VVNDNSDPSRAIGAGALVGLGIAAVLVPFCFFAAAGGHGTYAPMIACFPYTMLSAAISGRIDYLPLVFGLFQFPGYGGLVGWSRTRSKGLPIGFSLAIAHIGVGITAAIVAKNGGNFLR